MSDEASVYDLGDLESRLNGSAGVDSDAAEPSPAPQRRARDRVARSAAARTRPAVTRGAAPAPRPAPAPPRAALRRPQPKCEWRGSLSLFAPGTGLLLRGETALGMFFLSAVAFLAALFWAVLATLDRLSPTLSVLGQPREAAVWSLGACLAAMAVLHVTCVLRRPALDRVLGPYWPPHPAMSALASLLVPGWGQLLNGSRTRAAAFVTALWVAAAAWILHSPAAGSVLASEGLVLPRALELVASAPVRWTLPAVIWTLAVYDAATTAAARRAGR